MSVVREKLSSSTVPKDFLKNSETLLSKIPARRMTSNLFCYCFGYCDADIEQDVINNKGFSTIVEKIKASKKKGSCRCPENNPI